MSWQFPTPPRVHLHILTSSSAHHLDEPTHPADPLSSNPNRLPSRKRTNNGDSDSNWESKRSRASNTSRPFSTTVEDHIRNVYQDRCLYCTGRDVDGCHVYASTDDNFDDSYRYGLVSINSLGSKDNAVPLCSSCHKAYDRAWRPKLIIIPWHLDFFFTAEEQWQAAANDANNATEEVMAPRIPPNAADYMMHCRSMEDADTFIRGGLYACFADQEFLGRHPEMEPVITQWHGDPMAMLYRAMDAAHKIVRPLGLPVGLRTRLLDLRRLYEKGNTIMEAIWERQGAPGHGPSQSDNLREDMQDARPGPHDPHSMPPPGRQPSPDDADRNHSYTHTRNHDHTTNGIVSPPPTHTPSSKDGKRKRSSCNNSDASPKKRVQVEKRLSPASLQSLDSTLDPHQYLTAYLQTLASTAPEPEPQQSLPQDIDLDAEFNADAVSNCTSSPAETELKRECRRWEGRCANDAIRYWQRVFVAASEACRAAAAAAAVRK